MTTQLLPPVLVNTLANPSRCDFFQLVHLMEKVARAQARASDLPSDLQDNGESEALRFVGSASLGYPADEVESVTWQSDIQLSFLSLFGACGLLPHHYTVLIQQRLKLKDRAFRDFLNVLNHRMVLWSYRIWQHYCLPALYENAQQIN